MILLRMAEGLSRGLSMSPRPLSASQLSEIAVDEELPDIFGEAIDEFIAQSGEQASPDAHLWAAHRLGEGLDLLLASERNGVRRKLGSYYTPSKVAEGVIERSLKLRSLGERARQALRVCDPACGGGAFLLEAAAGLERLRGLSTGKTDFRTARAELVRELWGVDLSPLAVATAKIALWLFAGADLAIERLASQFSVGDALVGAIFPEDEVETETLFAEGAAQREACQRLDFHRSFPEVLGAGARGFDWIVGNPPWVAFQGRATQKITAERRSFYRKNFTAFSGYPTLHGLFIERATRLAPSGHLSLLIPSSVSDLDGYKNTRRCVMKAHHPSEPLLEFGQDAFSDVVQPCFGLVAIPGGNEASQPTRPWELEERSRAGAEVIRIAIPECFDSLRDGERLPKESFREMGFQSNRIVATQLFHRGPQPEGNFVLPLLEGRNVGEFSEREAKLFLHPDLDVLAKTRCRLQKPEAFASADLVVRQTAAFTIAALHGTIAFRNSLIAAFETSLVDKMLLLGLLNSSLFRALHVSQQRDARQAAFPQVKVSHLRSLPLPPDDAVGRDLVRKIAVHANDAGGLTKGARARLDEAVYRLFSLKQAQGEETRRYLLDLAPRALQSSLDGD